jgi:hypothetical protein
MNHTFNIHIAKRYGINEAIMISNFQYWIAKNKANEKHQYDGRTWTYNSVKAFEELFPYLTSSQIRRCLESLVEQGVLLKGDYNKNRYIRTSWFAFIDESAFLYGQMDLADLTNGDVKDDKCITDNKPNGKLDNNTGDNVNSSFLINPINDNPEHLLEGGRAAAAKKTSVQVVKENLKEKMGEYKDKYPREMLNEFFLYWTESSQTKKERLRYQDEKYFDVGRRLATWSKNASKNKFGEPIQPVKANSNVKFNIQ